MYATINDPKYRTVNRDVPAGSPEDWTRWNPWRAPGSAPVMDACGQAGGAPTPTEAHGIPHHQDFVDTKYAKFGDLGSKVLPYYPTGTVWEAGAVVETRQSIRANHGGGYQYRLCKLGRELTESGFQEIPIPFAGNSKVMMSNGTMLKLKSVFVSEGTLPAGSTWQMLGIPDTNYYRPTTEDGAIPDGSQPTVGQTTVEGFAFPPPCDEPVSPAEFGLLSQGRCSGQWMNNITIYDQLRIPADLEPGEYVLGFRWDCETAAQIWQAC